MSYMLPTKCPSCGTALVRIGANLFCPNDDTCHDQVAQRLQYAVSKGALDWDGFGPAMVETCIKAGITKLSQVIALNDADLAKNFKPAFIRKFVAERDRARKAPLWRKIYAMGIELVGQTSSKELCEHSNSLVGMLDLGPDKLQSILGPIASANFIAFLEKHSEEIGRLDEIGYHFVDEKDTTTPVGHQPLSGKTFVLTGGMLTGTRPQVSVTIEKYGGKVKGGVNKDTNYLVAGDGGGNNKAAAAQKFGTKIISEEDLYKMIGIEMPIAQSVAPEDEF